MDLSFFNEQQKKVVTHQSGPLLVVSGAGTGKTQTVTGRILYLMDEKKVSPENILALTFTEKAAEEMRSRVLEKLPLGSNEPCIKTFHALCESILREKGVEIGIAPDYRLLTEANLAIFMRRHALKFNLNYYRTLGNPYKFLGVLQDYFSKLMDEDIEPAAYLELCTKLNADADTEEKKEIAQKNSELAKAYEQYHALLLKNDALDFAGLIYYTLRLLQQRASVLSYYQQRFQYVIVDEFQDTNFAQNKLVTLLAQEHQNIMVVGDDDQSIYKWRGASLTNINYFKKIFPAAASIVLNENYRSHQWILDSAYHVIQKNNPQRLEVTQQVDKKLKSTSKITPIMPEVIHTDTQEEEIELVVKKATAALKKGLDTAILVRTNAMSAVYVEALEKRAVAVQHFAPSTVLLTSGVKDCLALLQTLASPDDYIALYRLLTLPFLGIPMEKIVSTIKKAQRQFLSILTALKEPPFEKISALLAKLLELSRNHKTSEILGVFFTETNYILHAEEHAPERLEEIAAFSQMVRVFEETHREAKLPEFLSYIELLQQHGEGRNEQITINPAAIKVMTIHGAKGLEFDAVFIPGLVSGKFPSIKRRDPIEVPSSLIPEPLPEGDFHLAEERRLFYVALTRTRQQLVLSHSTYYGSSRLWKPSPFVMEFLENKYVKKTEKTGKKKNLGQMMLPLERGKPLLNLNLPPLSYSQLDTFSTCPLKYQFRYLLKLQTPLPAAVHFGTSIHNTLRDFYTLLKTEALPSDKEKLNLLTSCFQKNWISYGYESSEFERDQKQRGVKMLERFYEKERENLSAPAFIEEGFSLALGPIKINGRIDRIDRLNDGTYEVIDYKTGSKKDSDLSNNLQLSLYALACRDVLKIPVSKVSLYFLEDLEKVSVTRSTEQLEKCVQEITQAAQEISESDFAPKPGFHCSYCDYRSICPAQVSVLR